MTTSMRALAIINPSSGSADPAWVERELRSRLPDLEVRRTPAGRDLVAFARAQIDAVQPQLLIASGGDGTVSALISALRGEALPLAIIPTGTANVLARELQVPLDIPSACDVLADRRLRVIDAMGIGEQRCVCRIGFGQVAEVGVQTSPEDKRQRSNLAYVRSAIPLLFEPAEYEFELELDGEVIRVRGSSVVVTNVNSVGMGELAWGDSVRPDDGVVDAVVVGASDLMDHLELLIGAMGRGATEAGVAIHYRARRSIVVRTEASIAAVADGEPIEGRVHEVQVHSSSVHVCVPNR